MKPTLLLTLFSLFLISLLSSCSKNESVTPASPLEGQWGIDRQITSDVPSSYSANGTQTTALNTNTYVFKRDNTFTNSYAIVQTNGAKYYRTDSGTWALAGPVGTVAVVTLNVTSATTSVTSQALPVSSQPLPLTYILTYSASTGELTTSTLLRTYNGPNPVTGITDLFKYTEKLVYKKKN